MPSAPEQKPIASSFTPACDPLVSGSLPHRNPAQAIDLMLRYSGRLPAWPELPHRDSGERGAIYSALGFPGLTDDRRSGQLIVQRDKTLNALSQLDLAYLENDLEYAAFVLVPPSGFEALRRRERPLQGACAVCGQIQGPISLALQLTDEQRRPLAYDTVLADALTRYLRLRIGWQETQLSGLAPTTVMCIHEPFLDAVGSPFLPFGWDEALFQIEEVLAGIQGRRGLVVGSGVPWAKMLDLSVDVIVVHVADGGVGLIAASDALAAFIERGGTIAYGVVPNVAEELATANAEALEANLDLLFTRLERSGLDRKRLAAAALIAPCGPLGGLAVEYAERALRLTAELSALMRRRYGFDNDHRLGEDKAPAPR